MKTLVVAIALLFFGLTVAEAVECKPSAGSGRWSYRNVDGKRCWFKGRYRSARNLYWPRVKAEAKPLPTKPKGAPAIPEDETPEQERERLETTVWPVHNFDERFRRSWEK